MRFEELPEKVSQDINNLGTYLEDMWQTYNKVNIKKVIGCFRSIFESMNVVPQKNNEELRSLRDNNVTPETVRKSYSVFRTSLQIPDLCFCFDAFVGLGMKQGKITYDLEEAREFGNIIRLIILDDKP